METRGRAPGPGTEAFVLLHGYGASAFTWRYWADGLAERGHVVLVDLKGFGSAPKPDDGRYSPLHQAELVRALLRSAGHRRVTLVGHSMGGAVALLVALGSEPPGLVGRLVLVAGAAYRQRIPPFVRLARFRRMSTAALRLVGARRVVRFVLRGVVYDPAVVRPAWVEGYADPLESADARRVLVDTARALEPPDMDRWVARLPDLDLPTLLLWGRHDPVVPLWVGERLARELPRARLHVLEACGHLPAEEQPEASLRALLDFLDETRRSAL